MPTGIRDVPPSRVGVVVQDFVDNGEERVDASKQPNGLFTVTPLSLDASSAGASREFAAALPPKRRDVTAKSKPKSKAKSKRK